MRSVARPRSEVVNSRRVIRYDAVLVTMIATVAARPIQTTKLTSGPSSPCIPRSRVCCTAIGTTTWPSEAITARNSVKRMPSFSSGENNTPRRMVAIAPISSPESIRVPEVPRRHSFRGPCGGVSEASGFVG